MIYTSEDEIKEMFRYHPVDSPERAEAHDNLNLAAQAFAIELFKAAKPIGDFPLIEDMINEVQVLRMMGNQYITYADIQRKRQHKNATKFLTQALKDD